MLDQGIDTSTWELGLHELSLRGQDGNLNWGPVNTSFKINITDTGGGGGATCTIGSNNNPTTLQWNNLDNFQAEQGPDRWRIDQIQVQDQDGDNDLDQLKLEIKDSGGTVRATWTTQLSGQQYQDTNVKIQPDDPSYDVPRGETYTLTATVCDVDGNSNTETRQDTS